MDKEKQNGGKDVLLDNAVVPDLSRKKTRADPSTISCCHRMQGAYDDEDDASP